MSYQIVGLANAVVDMCFRIDGFPIRPSEHQFTRNRLITPGGLANTLLCGARLGLNMKSIGNMGNDELGQLWRRHLEAEGVDTSDQIEYVDQPTTIAIALSDDAGEHLFIGSRGDLKVPNGRFPEVWRKSIAAADGLFIYGWNYLSQGPEANLEAMKTAQAANIPVFFDPGPEISHCTREWREAMMQGSSVVLLTYAEAEMIVEKSLPPRVMAQRLGQMGPELVILKLGGEGMIGYTVTETIVESGIEVEVVDLTGAGDSVTAAVMLAYFEGYSLPKMLRFANSAGAACVQKFGAGINVPTLAEITAVLEKAEGKE